MGRRQLTGLSFLLWLPSLVVSCHASGPKTCPKTICAGPAKPRERARPRPPPRDSFSPFSHFVLPSFVRGALPVSVSLSPKGGYMAVGRRYGLVDLVRLSDGKVVRRLGTMDELRQGVFVQFSRSGGLLACAGKSRNHIQIWDPDTGQVRKEWVSGLERITEVALAGGQTLLVAGPQGRIEAYEMASGKLLGRLRTTYKLEVVDLDGSADGTWAAAACEGSRLDIFNLQTFQKVGRAELHGDLSALAFVPGRDEVAVGTTSGTISFRAVPFADPVDKVRLTAPGPIRNLRFDGTGRVLAAGMASGGVALFDRKTGQRRVLAAKAAHPVAALVLAGKADLVAAVEEGVGVHLWWDKTVGIRPRASQPSKAPRKPPEIPALLTHRKIVVVRSTPFVISRIAVDKTGRLLAASGQPEQVAVWDAHSGRRRWYAKKPPGHVGYQTYLAKKAPRPVVMDFDPRNGRLHAFGRSNRLYRWQGMTGRPIRLWLNARGTLKGFIFAHDGRSFFLLLEESKVRRYRVDGTPLSTIKLRENPYWIGVCPNGKRFVSIAGWDEMSMYDVATGKRLWHKPSGAFDVYTVLGVRFDPTCKHLLTYHASGFARLFDVETGKLTERILFPLEQEPQACSIHPNARWIACARGRKVTIFSPFEEFRLDMSVPVGIGGAVRDLVFNLSGNTLVAQVGERSLVVWRFGVGPKVGAAPRQRGPVRVAPRPGRVPRMGTKPRVGVPRIVFPRARGIRRRAPRLSPGVVGPTLPDVTPRLGPGKTSKKGRKGGRKGARRAEEPRAGRVRPR